MKRFYLFKSVVAMSSSTSPLEMLSKIESTNTFQDGSSLCNMLMYGIQA
jgi:hypothetical protein